MIGIIDIFQEIKQKRRENSPEFKKQVAEFKAFMADINKQMDEIYGRNKTDE